MKDIIFCKGGGCTAKLGAGALSRVLSKLPKKEDPNLLVGFEGSDDAAVYRINASQAIVSTLDFFPPMLEDPYLFGKVAATNALSDIYAMGGQVLSALNIVCFPEKMDLNILGKILQGGNEKVTEAGAVLAGGHSIADEDIKYGLSVTGLVDPEKIWRNSGCREGDALILTKKLGVGIIMTAHRIREASEEVVNQAVESMTTLNKYASEILRQYQVHACTDVTGFGFLVHLSEMLEDGCSAVIQADQVPRFDKVEAYAEEFYLTAAAQKNRNFMGDKVEFQNVSFAMEEVLFDPQTSGGLLASVSGQEADSIVEELQKQGIPAQIVGHVIPRQEKTVYVRG
ncbi:MAG: selenide, water dikinase SelD [Lachnospiraceae bacterium]|nr:selenide, water dikinase SelD [Lachnospiraceae bacterium]